MQRTADINVLKTEALLAPRLLKTELPMTETANATVVQGRTAIRNILAGEDPRFLAVVGPCSIHNKQAALEYAQRLHELAEKVSETMLLVMRVYFEKPRTTVGWKGLINDPHLNDTFDIENGLRLARGILLSIAETGLPVATEMLEPITPQYIDELITLASIGARTTESPIHRQMASGLSMPVGYKNGTDGSLQVAIDAMYAAKTPHRFLGIDHEGQASIVHTKGNPWGHLILRGGRSGPNFDAESINEASTLCEKRGLSPKILVDCSHANSNKDFRKQPEVWQNVVEQRLAGNANIIGMMLESNLHEGNQKLTDDLSRLEYGISITDGCLGWEHTAELILETHKKFSEVGLSASV